jgi:hypothetical protein
MAGVIPDSRELMPLGCRARLALESTWIG